MNQESSKTFGDQAHLLRAIEHAITYDRQAAPRCVDMQPEYGSALIRFAEDDMAAVKEWAERTGATAVHGTTTYDTDRQWHEFGTRPGGARGQLVGWDVDLWCSVNSLPPIVVADDVKAVMAEAGQAMNATGDVQVYEPPADGEPQHRLAGGSTGGYGACSAVCLCGLTYAGFDTHREAAELIERHVADEAAKAKPLQVDNAIAAAEALEPKNTGRLAECGCPFFQDPLEDDPTVIHDTACQNWYFTFGSGHTHPESPAVNAEGGESLADRYVVIRGTYESARAIMLRFFGRVWCDQYETAEKAGVERFGLTELHRRHWPAPAAEVTATATQSGR